MARTTQSHSTEPKSSHAAGLERAGSGEHTCSKGLAQGGLHRRLGLEWTRRFSRERTPSRGRPLGKRAVVRGRAAANVTVAERSKSAVFVSRRPERAPDLSAARVQDALDASEKSHATLAPELASLCTARLIGVAACDAGYAHDFFTSWGRP